ncbi:hypothetical protein SMC92_002568 [Cronobacter dublinensis]|nr:hypothetical protein [Cronobacter dublinensis]
MGFYTRLEKIDAAVNRGYARWGKWIWLGLSLPVVFYAAWLVWASIWGPPTGAVTLIIHSELDRPVLEFSVNGVAGGNAFVRDKTNPYSSDTGGVTCCGSISGDTAEVIWTLSTTRDQYNAGLRKETRRIVMPLPKREWGENYLHVYFLANNKVYLWWSADFSHPDIDSLPVNTKQTIQKEPR